MNGLVITRFLCLIMISNNCLICNMFNVGNRAAAAGCLKVFTFVDGMEYEGYRLHKWVGMRLL